LPIAGVVILDRRKDIKASIARAAPSTALKALIDRNFGILHDPSRIFDCFHALVRSAECHVLTYSDTQEAVELLQATFDRATIREEVGHALA
jgi:hypothetical protein